MNGITRRGFLKSAGAVAVGAAVVETTEADKRSPLPAETILKEGWFIQSSTLVDKAGEAISGSGFATAGWHKASIPCTVLSALVKNGIYPDPRNGLDCYKIPDSSDEFNQKHDLARFSHLPDKRNPWRDPYWYRTEFKLDSMPAGRRLWLHFDAINYRADVWVNGKQIADREKMAGMFRRFQFDITGQARTGVNALAVKIYPVGNPGTPDTQLEVLGKYRSQYKEIARDVTENYTIGYDCMMTVPDRNMGIWQDVWLDWTGPVEIRNPFVVTDLPLPETSRASLTVSAELVNAAATPLKGILRGSVAGTEARFRQPVELGPNETKVVSIDPKPVMTNPRLWWPVNYGEQSLYDLELQFETGGAVSDEQRVSFGVRKVTTEMHEHNGSHGRRVLINGQKILCRGGYIQPELLMDWDARRMDTEIRYYAEANLNLIYCCDVPNLPDAFLDACDRHGVMFGNCFYTDCADYPNPKNIAVLHTSMDLGLLESCTVDVIKRYRNHSSLVMYLCMVERTPPKDLYEMWRRNVVEFDGTRWFIPSGYFPDDRKDVAEWLKADLPTGMNDWPPKSYGWQELDTYFRWVRDVGNWMFKIESGSASVPPISSLNKFIGNASARSAGEKLFPLTPTWAHHGANNYYAPCDAALRRLHGEPDSVVDYCWKQHLVTADQNRAMFEAVNHRMWEITSGFTQWKINSCEPSIQWQIFDWYHKPMVSWFYIRKAGEPLHVQLNSPDRMVSVINTRLTPQRELEVRARVFDLNGKLLWEKTDKGDAPANSYRETFTVAEPSGVTPVYFVKLELTDGRGRLVSDNFYWLRAKDTADFKALESLPPAKLESASKIEDRGAEKLVRVTVTNPGPHLAFFVQLALTQGRSGAEILPVLWEDNYFSLLPGEMREVTARIAARDVGRGKPVLEVGGWNIQTGYRCLDLKPSKTTVIAGESFSVTARIADTFLDGSRVVLLVDGQPGDSGWAWARGGKSDEVTFKVDLARPGLRQLMVGNRKTQIHVE
jgi:exo-1,4-beta-D-glucosaminidase